MSCDRFTAAIADHACGADLAPDAAAHLRTCAACASLLASQRRAIDGLDGELEALLAIEPSAHFVPRVQAHAASEPPARPRWIFMWSGMAAAAAVAIAAFALTVREPTEIREGAATPMSAARTPDPAATRDTESVAIARDGSAASVVPSRVQARRRTTTPAATQAVSTPAAAPEPDVLVPPGQMQAVDRYMALVRSGRLETATLLANNDVAPVPAELVLGPLEIGAMTVKELDESTATAVERRQEQEQPR